MSKLPSSLGIQYQFYNYLKVKWSNSNCPGYFSSLVQGSFWGKKLYSSEYMRYPTLGMLFNSVISLNAQSLRKKILCFLLQVKCKIIFLLLNRWKICIPCILCEITEFYSDSSIDWWSTCRFWFISIFLTSGFSSGKNIQNTFYLGLA